MSIENPSPPSPSAYTKTEELSRWRTPQAVPQYGGVPGLAVDADGNPFIADIQSFLDTCPQRDPNLMQIRSDFQIRKDGVVVATFPCSEPVSELPVAQFTDELIYLQMLRAMYYMDHGQRGHLSWTPGALYDWMKSKIGGVDIVTGVVGGYCCETKDGLVFFVGGTHDDPNREFDKTWDGISNVMAFAAHERRHLDDDGHPHTSCCGITNGCDDNFDPANLSAYGVQWWLEKDWLNGDINVGVGCLSQDLITQDAGWHLSAANYTYRSRFCYTKPAFLTVPAVPGGACDARPMNLSLFVPVVLGNVTGVAGSVYTTELTLASKATDSVQFNLLYTASVGAGTGTASVTLAPGETLILPDALSFLRSQGLQIPTSGNAIGTLLVTFAGASGDPFIGGRTFTSGGGGTFGLFYPAAATTTTTATLVGLQQNDIQRSNLALANAGATPIALRVQLLGPLGEDLGTLPDQNLPPYGWAQISQPLLGKAGSARAVITEISGSSPFTAYGVLNDAVTSDGSFIPPLIGNDSGPGDRLVPIVLDVHGLAGTHYTTELTLANLTSRVLPVTLVYTASLGSGSGQATVTLAPGEQRIVPDAIGFLRAQGLPIPNDGTSVGGSLLAQLPSGSLASAFAVGARTFTPASTGGGTFGVYYPGVTVWESASSVAYVNGLQQNSAQRSNLAIVNRGEAGDSITLSVSYFDRNGGALGSPTAVTLAPGQWTQFGQPLQALGVTLGRAKIEKTSGASRFVAYGVLNDAVTSDGSYIPMSF